jgi:hypothetical protein
VTSRRGTVSMRDLMRGVGVSARPSKFRGVEMRSVLETRFAEYLDHLGLEWSYEPRRFGQGKSYLPDFEILNTSRPTFIEVKPTPAEVEPAQERMALIWQTIPEAVLIVACWENLTFTAATRGSEWESWTDRWAA